MVNKICHRLSLFNREKEKMAKFVSAKEAAQCITDHATVALAGLGLAGWPEEIACAIRDNYKECGHPADLALRQGSAMGDWRDRGVTVLGEAGEGLITRWSGAHVGSAFALNKLAVENKLQCTCLPQGCIVNLWREIAAGRPGLLTKVGLGTFVDPRFGGGKMNECTTEELVRLTEIDGEEYLFYPSFKLDVALLRGTIADENGNISFAHESILNEGLAVATAAHNCGGIVIVQVEYMAKAGTLHPKEIKIPGILVDYVVIAQDKRACWQTEGVYYEPAFNGDIKKPVDHIAPVPFDVRKVIARRCAMELKKGETINLGVGMAADTASIIAEEGFQNDVIMTTESGMIGGVPAALPNFGSAYNPEAIVDHGAMFDMIDGGFLDVTILGIGEIDKYGNNNVSKMGNRLTGPGGFINITQKTPKVIFCGTLVGKAKYKLGDGKITVTQEGKIKKFVNRVGQITYSTRYKDPEQEVIYITERCVMKLINHQLTITEIAPGIDLEKDIMNCMEFEPVVADNLKVMDPKIFFEEWGRLGDYMGKEAKKDEK